jgi:hypothetical protein
MSDTYQRWRTADRKAYELEQWLRIAVRPPSCREVTRAELELAKELRAAADDLFIAAMRELDAEVAKAVAPRAVAAADATSSTRATVGTLRPRAAANLHVALGSRPLPNLARAVFNGRPKGDLR